MNTPVFHSIRGRVGMKGDLSNLLIIYYYYRAMNVFEIFTIAMIGASLAMDALAVSITQGACLDIRSPRYPLIIGLTFGFFQALMPFIGWLLGSAFHTYIQKADHWIALTLLAAIGIKMFIDGYKDFLAKNIETEEGAACEITERGHLRLRILLGMGVATSIDALAVGVTFGVMKIDIFVSILIIGIITFIISFAGVLLGKKAGPFLGDRMEMIGGAVLVLLGVKIMAEHLIKGI